MQVLLEATTPLLHLLGCLKTLGHDKHPLFVACALLFIAQFLVCRVVLGNLVLLWMVSAVAQSAPTQVQSPDHIVQTRGSREQDFDNERSSIQGKVFCSDISPIMLLMGAEGGGVPEADSGTSRKGG